jgi:hypothetical protein
MQQEVKDATQSNDNIKMTPKETWLQKNPWDKGKWILFEFFVPSS